MSVKKQRRFEHKGSFLSYDDLSAVTTEHGRRYTTPEGNIYPSITTILSILSEDSIAKWRKRVGEDEANRISTRASIRGEKVHLACEDYVNNVPWEEIKAKNTPDIIASLLQIRPVLDERVGTVYCQEVPLYSDYLKVAGRVDMVAEFDGKLSIIDYKTSKKMKKEEYIENYYCQESAYAIMWEEQTKIPIKQLVTIIAVDEMGWGQPAGVQVFIEDRDNWTAKLLSTIKQYEARHESNEPEATNTEVPQRGAKADQTELVGAVGNP